MNDVWKRILKEWVKMYEAIDTLQDSLFEDEEASELRCKLLDEIIETCKTEVEMG